MGIVYQGATPTITIELPVTIDSTDFVVAYLTFKQNGKVILEKDLDDMAVGTTNNVLIVALTQEETLMMLEGDVSYQFTAKYENGQRIITNKVNFAVGESYKNERI